MDKLQAIRNLVGKITLEDLKYVDYYVSEDLGIFIPSVGYCGYAIIPNHTHPCYSFVLMLTNADTETFFNFKSDPAITPTQYQAAILPPDIPHEEEVGDSFIRYIAIMVSKDLFEKIYLTYSLSLPTGTTWEPFLVSKEIMPYINRFMDESESRHPYPQQILNALGTLITNDLIYAFTGSPSSVALAGTNMQSILDFLQQNFMYRISVAEMAEKIHLSKAHFEKLFRKETGASPIQYLIRLRLEKAKKLLRSETMNISEIALYCGFNSPSHFTSCFKAHFNITPSSYRIQQLSGTLY